MPIKNRAVARIRERMIVSAFAGHQELTSTSNTASPLASIFPL
jgi:hypothetical protein